MHVVADHVIKFGVDLPLEFLPGEVHVLLFGAKTSQSVSPVLGVLQLERFIHQDSYASALREFLSLEEDVLGRRHLPWKLIALFGCFQQPRKDDSVESYVVFSYEVDVPAPNVLPILLPQ